MVKTTQNNWVPMMPLHDGGNRLYTKQDLDRVVADARKEGYEQRMFTIDSLKKTCRICGVIEETAFHKDASQSHDGCENNYNKAIDDVLSTLRKESK